MSCGPDPTPDGLERDAGGVTDHGALTGLTDDDHTIYALVDGSRAFTGQITTAAGSAASPAIKLGVSTAGLFTDGSNGIMARGSAEIARWSGGGITLNGLPVIYKEQTAPTGTANQAKVYAQDNGGGKTQLMVIFGTGAAQQIAIEP